MNCSYTLRCDNPKLIYFDDIYIFVIIVLLFLKNIIKN